MKNTIIGAALGFMLLTSSYSYGAVNHKGEHPLEPVGTGALNAFEATGCNQVYEFDGRDKRLCGSVFSSFCLSISVSSSKNIILYPLVDTIIVPDSLLYREFIARDYDAHDLTPDFIHSTAPPSEEWLDSIYPSRIALRKEADSLKRFMDGLDAGLNFKLTLILKRMKLKAEHKLSGGILAEHEYLSSIWRTNPRGIQAFLHLDLSKEEIEKLALSVPIMHFYEQEDGDLREVITQVLLEALDKIEESKANFDIINTFLVQFSRLDPSTNLDLISHYYDLFHDDSIYEENITGYLILGRNNYYYNLPHSSEIIDSMLLSWGKTLDTLKMKYSSIWMDSTDHGVYIDTTKVKVLPPRVDSLTPRERLMRYPVEMRKGVKAKMDSTLGYAFGVDTRDDGRVFSDYTNAELFGIFDSIDIYTAYGRYDTNGLGRNVEIIWLRKINQIIGDRYLSGELNGDAPEIQHLIEQYEQVLDRMFVRDSFFDDEFTHSWMLYDSFMNFGLEREVKFELLRLWDLPLQTYFRWIESDRNSFAQIAAFNMRHLLDETLIEEILRRAQQAKDRGDESTLNNYYSVLSYIRFYAHPNSADPLLPPRRIHFHMTRAQARDWETRLLEPVRTELFGIWRR